MSSPQPPRRHHVSLLSSCRGERALDTLSNLVSPFPHPSTLEIVASGVRESDPRTGAVLRIGMDAHLAADGENRVSLWEPLDQASWNRLSDLLGDLPERCELCNDTSAPARDRDVLMPATSLTDQEDVDLAAEWLNQPQLHAGMNSRVAYLVSAAMATLGSNALQYASGRERAPVACAALDPLTNEIELVVVDSGHALAARGGTAEPLREAIEASRRRAGGLVELLRLSGRRGVTAELQLAGGTERARVRGRTSYSSASHFGGFAAGFVVKL